MQGFFLDAYASFVNIESMHPYIALLLGCMFSAVGLTIYMKQGLSPNAIDNFTYMLHKEKKMKMNFAKILCDSIPLMIILATSIRIQAATLLVYVLVPTFMLLIQKCKKNDDA